jgi:peptidoglycan hydrolase CwlO-like protein
MVGAASDAARAWRRNELDKLRTAVARASAEMKRLDSELDKLAAALGPDSGAAALAVLASLHDRRAEASAEIDRLMRAAADAFAAMVVEPVASAASAPPETAHAAAG